jgi:hypothetical protein
MKTLFSCGYLCAGIVAFSALSMAQTVTSGDQTTGMVGLSNNQAARLNVLNIAPASTATAAVCAAQLQIIDAGGGVIKQATLAVPTGKAVAIQLMRADVTNASGPRIELRGQVNTVLTPDSTASTTVCSLVVNLEIIDEATGSTTVIAGGGHTLPAAPAPAAGN